MNLRSASGIILWSLLILSVRYTLPSPPLHPVFSLPLSHIIIGMEMTQSKQCLWDTKKDWSAFCLFHSWKREVNRPWDTVWEEEQKRGTIIFLSQEEGVKHSLDRCLCLFFSCLPSCFLFPLDTLSFRVCRRLNENKTWVLLFLTRFLYCSSERALILFVEFLSPAP